MPHTGPHPFSYDEEMESFDEKADESRRASNSRRLFRPSYLFMIILVFVVLFATFFNDMVEIDIDIQTVQKKASSLFGSSSTDDSSPPKNSDQIGMEYEKEIQSGDFTPPDPAKSKTVPALEAPAAVKPKEATEPLPAPKTPASQPTQPQSSSSALHPLAGEPGFKPDPQVLSDTYLKRGKPMDDKAMAELGKKWGRWNFVDPKADKRPKEDFYAAYPSRDVPYEKFPDNAWQKDKDYLSKFVPEAKALVERAMEAILAEYGHSKFDEPDKDFETRAEMFSIAMYNFTGSKPDNKRGGWMPQRSIEGLVRRVLHAVMTEDTFTLATGGHSAAAGEYRICEIINVSTR